jgi:hypothetical protein
MIRIEVAANPFFEFSVLLVSGIADRIEEFGVAPGGATIFARAAAGRARSNAKMLSNFPTASKAIGEIVVGLPLRAFDAMSASLNSLRRACAQPPASVIGPPLRFAS